MLSKVRFSGSLILFSMFAFVMAPVGGQAASKGNIRGDRGPMPRYFTANVGQFSDEVKFQGRSGPSTFWFTANGVSYHFMRSVSEKSYSDIAFDEIVGPNTPLPPHKSLKPSESMFINVSLVGDNPPARVFGMDEISGKSNYFIGNDPSKWYRDVSNYESVFYEEAYPGVDLKFYYAGTVLEYDFIVSPGSDPNQIRLRITGANGLALNDAGELVIQTPWGPIKNSRPIVYQTDGYTRVEVPASYLLVSDNTFGFEILGKYSHKLPLIIDPRVLYYSTYLGGENSNSDEAWGVAVDDCENVYVAGYTTSTDFETKSAYDNTFNALIDGFVTKFNTKRHGASSLVYSTYFGGNDTDLVYGVAIDDDGNAYITGSTKSSDMPIKPDPGAYDDIYDGDYDGFITKLNPAGNDLVYSTYFGTTGAGELGQGIAVNSSGSAYVTGYTAASGNIETKNGFQDISDYYSGLFIKLSADGAQLEYGTMFGGTFLLHYDFGRGIAVDNAGNAYICGHTRSVDLQTKSGNFDVTHNGIDDAIILKIDPDSVGLASLIYGTYVGGTGGDYAKKITLDSANKAYITGYTTSTDFPLSADPMDDTRDGSRDAFVFVLSADGNDNVYATYLGGNDEEEGFGIGVVSDGSIYVAGHTKSTNFPVTTDAFQSTHDAEWDVFVIKLDPSQADSASQVLFSTYLGGSGEDETYDMAVLDDNNVYVVGETESDNFDVTATAYDNEFNDGTATAADAFLFRITDFAWTTCKRGDVNKDGTIDEKDYDDLSDYLFNSGSLSCLWAGNVNCDCRPGFPSKEKINIVDLTTFVQYLVSCTALCSEPCGCNDSLSLCIIEM